MTYQEALNISIKCLKQVECKTSNEVLYLLQIRGECDLGTRQIKADFERFREARRILESIEFKEVQH